MRHTIERLTGQGVLRGEGMDHNVFYALVVEQDMIESRTMGNPPAFIPGMKTISGCVRVIHPSQMPGPSVEKFLLRLSDGRQLRVFHLGNGSVKGTGDFF